MSRYIVQAVRREGFRGVWRAGREFSHEPVEVEVLDDQEGDPTLEVVDDATGKKRTIVHPTRLGMQSWLAVLADGRISKTPVETRAAGSLEAEVVQLRRRVAELEAQLAVAKAVGAEPPPAELEAPPAEAPPAPPVEPEPEPEPAPSRSRSGRR